MVGELGRGLCWGGRGKKEVQGVFVQGGRPAEVTGGDVESAHGGAALQWWQ